ncbi:MAG TPA: protein kinase [Kofleriaceae bacterium]|nr:protein kinase [Kofleriaceae bacterium]
MVTALGPDETAADLAPGAVVGEYLIERKLKQGGMGTVYEAVHQVIHKRAAVKVLKRELCENEETVHRFLQEARAVNRIGHPNIVDVFGFGVTPDGRSFLAMELLVGETLGERFSRGPVRRSEACDIVVEITHALEAAHACGIIHRDLKPENVFLAAARGGVIVKLLDFGIAKLTGGGGLTGPVEVTQPGTVIGTPKYIAPEQARGLPIDGSADVYALGVILFELLTGRPPFIGSDPVELIAKHVALSPPRPSELDPTLPPVADTLLGEMLAKDPSARPSLARMRELVAEVRAAPEVETSIAASRGPATTIIHAVDDGAVVAPKRRRWLVPVAAVVLVAAGVRVATWIADRHANEAAPRATSVVASPFASAAPVVRPPTPPTPPTPAASTITVTPIEPAPEPVAATPPKPGVAPKPHASHATVVKHVTTHAAELPARAAVPSPDPAQHDTTDPKPAAPPDDDALRDPFHHH